MTNPRNPIVDNVEDHADDEMDMVRSIIENLIVSEGYATVRTAKTALEKHSGQSMAEMAVEKRVSETFAGLMIKYGDSGSVWFGHKLFLVRDRQVRLSIQELFEAGKERIKGWLGNWTIETLTESLSHQGAMHEATPESVAGLIEELAEPLGRWSKNFSPAIPTENISASDPRATISYSPFGLDQRSADIVARRYCPNPETLEQIGKSLGVTRERVRQIEKKSIRAIKKSTDYDSLLFDAKRSLVTRGYISTAEVDRIARSRHLGMRQELSRAIAAFVVESLRTGDEPTGLQSVAVDGEPIRDCLELVQELMGSVGRQGRQVADCPSAIAAQVAKHMGRDLGMDVIDIETLIVDLYPEIRDQAKVELRRRRALATAPNLARQVLKESTKPLHREEIAGKVAQARRDLGMRPLADASVFNVLYEYPNLFSYVNQGTYGLREWGSSVPYIRDIITEVLASTGRPMTQAEIGHRVRKIRPVKDSSLIMYIDMDHRFYRARSGKYGLREWLDSAPTIRTPRDLVEHPASSRRLKNNHH